MYVRKEAVLTSQIEGTQSTLADGALSHSDRAKVEKLGRAAPPALKVYDFLRDRILISSTKVAEALGLTRPTVQAAIERPESRGIAKEVIGKTPRAQRLSG
jgi:Fic family protein